MDNRAQTPAGLEEIRVRPLEERDNPALASVIRKTLKEFGANRPGTVYFDEATDHLFELFRETPRSFYQVAEYMGEVIGGGGIFPSPGLPPDTCELVKMYLLPPFRSIGLGRKLISDCLDFARNAGYSQVYIESMPELTQALKTYEKFGFTYLDGPMGNTGHFGCDQWMLKKL